jgi:trk system potassium uptake protein TrkH
MLDLRPVLYVTGMMIAALGVIMFIPMSVDFFYKDESWQAFGVAGFVTALFGGILTLTNYAPNARFRARGAFLLTTMSWVGLSVFAALPLLLSSIGLGVTDSLFEAVSGITTTGSTVMTGLDDAPKGVLLWRAILQWIGGVGIIVTAMAILPMLNVGGMQLFRLESSDMGDKILPNAAELAKAIGLIYLGLTILCAICYMSVGMSGFDAIAHSMTTISTGGYSTSDASLGGFIDDGADLVAIVFMLAGALPFGIYLLAVSGKIKPALFDPQVRAFFLVVSLFIAVMTMYLWLNSIQTGSNALRLSAFNVVSVVTGTGYATADYNACRERVD